jgi:alkanesulfonate monooxygenase SsuD/methylene tetrahydromethanopterin reductase-like flavin-dependent oxidoreductase (luciferase family)
VRSGPGLVEHGVIAPLPPKLTVEELEENLLIGSPQELVDKLGVYKQAGVDETILNMNIGATQAETLYSMQRFAEEVMPHLVSKGEPRRRSA